MAKKVNKKASPAKARRTNSMEKCIADAEDFIKAGKGKKIVKTKTMARTLEEGKQILAPKRKANKLKKATTGPKRIKRKVLASIPARPSMPAPAFGLPSLAPAVLPASTGATIIRARSIDRSIKPTKATIFKTGSRDNLPLPSFGFIDVCFCSDVTGSMGGQLAQVQSTIVAIIEKIQNKVRTQGITLRFAVVAYRDHCDSSVVQFQDFTDAQDTIQYVRKISAWGGGDEPEAAHDGLLKACQNLNWVQMPGTPMLRYIFHILDAPPHGKEFGTGEDRQGCTCGIKTDDVIHQINLKQIHYRMIKARRNSRVDITEDLFRKKIVDFDSADIATAQEMNIRVSDMIIHEILPQA